MYAKLHEKLPTGNYFQFRCSMVNIRLKRKNADIWVTALVLPHFHREHRRSSIRTYLLSTTLLLNQPHVMNFRKYLLSVVFQPFALPRFLLALFIFCREMSFDGDGPDPTGHNLFLRSISRWSSFNSLN